MKHQAEPTRPTVVQAWAPNCPACRAMRGDLEATAAEFAGRVDLVLVNAARESETARALGVLGTPTLIGFEAGGELVRHTGRLGRAELAEFFQAVADGAPDRSFGRRQGAFRLAVGVTVVVVGLLTGPAWPLVVVGALTAGWGAATGWSR